MGAFDEIDGLLAGLSPSDNLVAPSPAIDGFSEIDRLLGSLSVDQQVSPQEQITSDPSGLQRQGLFGLPIPPSQQESIVAQTGNPNKLVRDVAERQISNSDFITGSLGMGLQGLQKAVGGGLDFIGLDTAGGLLKDSATKRIEEIRGLFPEKDLAQIDEPLFADTGEGFFDFEISDDATIKGFAGKVAQQIPNLAASVGGGIGLAKGITNLGIKLFPKVARKTLAKGGGALGFGTSEGAIELGFTKAEVEDAINAAPIEVLQDSQGFKEIYTQLISQEFSPENAELEARAILADEISQRAAKKVGVTTALLGAPLGAYFNVLSKFKLSGRVAQGVSGAVGEGLQETAQEAVGSVIKENLKGEAGLKMKTPSEIRNSALESGLTATPLGGGTALALGSGTTPAEEAGKLLDKQIKDTPQETVDNRIEGVETINNVDELETFAQGTAVVDDEGKPLEVFHGTTKNFKDFSFKEEGGVLPEGKSFEAAFFTSDPNDADFYGSNSVGQDGLNIRPAFLNMKNPFITSIRKFSSNKTEIIRKAKAKGHDGVILRLDGKKKKGDHYIVFSNDQIRQRFTPKPEPRTVAFKTVSESQADTTINLEKSPRNPDLGTPESLPDDLEARQREIGREEKAQENERVKEENANKILEEEASAEANAKARTEPERKEARNKARNETRSKAKAERIEEIQQEFKVVEREIAQAKEEGANPSDITALEIDREILRKKGQSNRVADLEKAGQRDKAKRDKAKRLKTRIEKTESKIDELTLLRETQVNDEKVSDVEGKALSSIEKSNKARRIRDRLASEEAVTTQNKFVKDQKRSQKQRRKDAAELEQLQRDIDSLDTVEAPAAQATQPPSTTDSEDLSTLGANTPQQSPSVGVPQSVQAQETSTDTSKDNIAPVEESFKPDPVKVKQIQTDKAVASVEGSTNFRQLSKNKSKKELVAIGKALGVKTSNKQGRLGNDEIARNIFKELKNRGVKDIGSKPKPARKAKPGKSSVAIIREQGGLNLENFRDTLGAGFIDSIASKVKGLFKIGNGMTVDGLGLFLNEAQVLPDNFDNSDVQGFMEKLESDLFGGETNTINDEAETSDQIGEEAEKAGRAQEETDRLTDKEFNSLEAKAQKGELTEDEQPILKKASDIRLKEQGYDPNQLAFLGTDQVAARVTELFKALKKRMELSRDDIKSVGEFMGKTPLTREMWKVLQDGEKRIFESKKVSHVKILRALNRAFVDVAGNVRRTLDKTEGGRSVLVAFDAVQGAPSEAARRIKDFHEQTLDLLSAEEEAIVGQIIKAKRNVEISLTRPEVKHEGGFTGEQYQEFLDQFPQELMDRLNPTIDKIFDFFKTQLNSARDEGLVSEEGHAAMIKSNYSPRLFEQHIDPQENVNIDGRVVTVPNSGLKALKEGDITAMESDIRLLSAQYAGRLWGRIFKNRANQEMADFIAENPDNGFANLISNNENAPGGYSKFSYMEEGQPKSFTLENELASEWVIRNPAITGMLANAIQWASGVKPLKATATSFNPLFFVTNLPRDLMHTYFVEEQNSQHLPIAVGEMAVDGLETFKDAWSPGVKGAHKDFIEQGGGMNFLTEQGKVLDSSGTARRIGVTAAIQKLQDFLSYTGSRSELHVRLMLRNRALKNGLSEQEATWIARRYLDFGRGGYVSKALDNGSAYLNAGIQATRGIARAVEEQSTGTIITKLSWLAVLSTGLLVTARMVMGDDYDDIPSDVRARHWIIPTGMKREGRHLYLKIAKDQGQAFYTAGIEAGANKVMGYEVDTDAIVIAGEQTNPVTPSGLEPPSLNAWNTYFNNYDSFKKKENWRGLDVESSEEFYPWTHPLAVKLGKLTSSTNDAGENEGGISPVGARAAMSKLFALNNPAIGIPAVMFRTFMDEVGPQTESDIYDAINHKIPVVGKFFKWTDPEDNFKTRNTLKDAQVKTNTRKLRQKRGLDKALEVSPEAGRQFVNSQGRLDRERLRGNVKGRREDARKGEAPEQVLINKLERFDNESAARAIVGLLKDASPSQAIKLNNAMKRNKRFNTSNFRKFFRKFKKENN